MKCPSQNLLLFYHLLVNMESELVGENKRNIEFIPVLFFLPDNYINQFQPSLVHNEEDATS